MPYLTDQGYRARTDIPPSWVDEIESESPGWLTNKLEMLSARIDASLGAAYPTPFAEPSPAILLHWLTVLTDWSVLKRRGADSTTADYESYRTDATAVYADLSEAARSTGAFALPTTLNASGATKRGIRSHSVSNPYEMRREHAATARSETRLQGGTTVPRGSR